MDGEETVKEKERKNVSFHNDGRRKLFVIVGTSPEIIRLSQAIKKS